MKARLFIGVWLIGLLADADPMSQDKLGEIAFKHAFYHVSSRWRVK